MSTLAQKRAPVITVRSGLYTAVIGALGDILTLLAIPVGPNVSINLYVLSGALVGSTNGWLLGAIAGFIGALYTPILWGWFGAILYAAIIGALTGLLATKVGLRPVIAGTLASIIALPYMAWSEMVWLGMAWPVVYLTIGTTVFQMFVASLLAEIIINIPGMKKRFPKSEIHAYSWVAKSKLLRHPWLDVE
jgi:hypothetical protein